MALSQEELQAKLAALKFVFSESAYKGGNGKKLSLREIANIHLSNIDHAAETPLTIKMPILAGPPKPNKKKRTRVRAKAKAIKPTKSNSKKKSKSKKVVKKKLRTTLSTRKVNNIAPIVFPHRLSNTNKKPLRSVLKPAFKNTTVVTAGDGVRLLGGLGPARLAAQKLRASQITKDMIAGQPILSASKRKVTFKKENKASSTNLKSKGTNMVIKHRKTPRKPYADVTARVDSGLNPDFQQVKSKSVVKKLKTKGRKRKNRFKHSSRVLFKNVFKPDLMTANDAAASAYELLHHSM